MNLTVTYDGDSTVVCVDGVRYVRERDTVEAKALRERDEKIERLRGMHAEARAVLLSALGQEDDGTDLVELCRDLRQANDEAIMLRDAAVDTCGELAEERDAADANYRRLLRSVTDAGIEVDTARGIVRKAGAS